ncbi:MAG: inovirus Gp2 family protein [Cellvibrionales bacterium]|nr:inovirus Gp2 family protein [Cellvibrionales bacterium]
MKTINKNLTLFMGTHYRGFPVYQSPGGLILEYMDICHEQSLVMGCDCKKALLIRFDAKFPKYFDAEHMDTSNEVVSKFIKKLGRLLDQRERRKTLEGKRVSPHYMRYVWVREQSYDNDHWHYHFLLLVNKHTFRSVGVTENVESLGGIVKTAWSHALKVHECDARGLIYIPSNAGYIIDYAVGMSAEAFYRISYMCKAKTKAYGLGSHVIGYSRITK